LTPNCGGLVPVGPSSTDGYRDSYRARLIRITARSAQRTNATELARIINSTLADASGENLRDAAWGTAAKSHPGGEASDAILVSPRLRELIEESSTGEARLLSEKLLALSRSLRLTPEETKQISRLTGILIVLALDINIEIHGNGDSEITYRYHMLNMKSRPVSRVSLDFWFKHVYAPLSIEPSEPYARSIVVQPIHSMNSQVKFFCQMSPPLAPGETRIIEYVGVGGRFVDERFWRLTVQWFTRHATIRVHQRATSRLISCAAVEYRQDGVELGANEDIVWEYDDDSEVVITLTRDYLRPGGALTLWWDVEREVLDSDDS
jgi:hypothetical protein